MVYKNSPKKSSQIELQMIKFTYSKASIAGPWSYRTLEAHNFCINNLLI